jgi:predicted nucleotidyltransferase
MSNGSDPPSITPSKPVDPSTIRVLRAVHHVASASNCPFFVAGATARDLMLVNVYGLRPGRATRDIDFGIAVESWDEFQTLKGTMIATGEFAGDSKAQQRLVYTDSVVGFSIPVDLIPFRGVASANQTIAWPPARDVVLNIAGFEEAWASSLPVEVDEGLTVRVASVPGLTLLKLIAWADRRAQNNKDAADLYRLLTTYTDAGNFDRLYDQELALLEAVEFDLELAGAELLGRDVARICTAPGSEQARAWLTSPRFLDQLVGHMVQTSTHSEAVAAVSRIVDSFCRGFLG